MRMRGWSARRAPPEAENSLKGRPIFAAFIFQLPFRGVIAAGEFDGDVG